MVDIDGNKVVTIEEFVFSIMGDAAMKYGPLAEMDDINVRLNKAVRSFKESLVAAKEDTDNRASRNASNRMEDMKRNMGSDMVEFMNQMKSGIGMDPSASLRNFCVVNLIVRLEELLRNNYNRHS